MTRIALAIMPFDRRETTLSSEWESDAFMLALQPRLHSMRLCIRILTDTTQLLTPLHWHGRRTTHLLQRQSHGRKPSQEHAW